MADIPPISSQSTCPVDNGQADIQNVASLQNPFASSFYQYHLPTFALSRFGLPLLFSSSLNGCSQTSQCEEPEIINESSGEVTDEHIGFIRDAFQKVADTIQNGQSLLCGIKEIKVVDNVKHADGSYRNGKISIEYKTLKNFSFEALIGIVHEIGHHIENNLNSDQFKKFQNICRDNSVTRRVQDPEAYLSAYPGFTNYHGMLSPDEDFATIFSYYVLIPGHLEFLASQNEYLKSKLDFMETCFHRIESRTSYTAYGVEPIETLSPVYSNADSVFVDEADGTTWVTYERGNNTLSSIHLNQDGMVDLMGEPYPDPYYDYSFVEVSRKFYNGQSFSIGYDHGEGGTLSLGVWVTHLQNGTQRKYFSSGIEGDYLEVLDFDHEEGKLYYVLHDTSESKIEVFEWDVNLGTHIKLDLIDSAEMGRVTPGYVYFVDSEKQYLWIYDKKSKNFYSVLIPNYLQFQHLIPFENKIIMIGAPNGVSETYQGMPLQAIVYDPQKNSLTSFSTGFNGEELNPDCKIYPFWDGDLKNPLVLRVLNADYNEADYSLTDYYLSSSQAGSIIPDISVPDSEKAFLFPDSQEYYEFSADGYLAHDAGYGYFYSISRVTGTDSEGSKTAALSLFITDERKVENFTVLLPDILSSNPLLYSDAAFYANDGRLLMKITAGSSAFYYELNWDDMSFVEIDSTSQESMGTFSYSNRIYIEENDVYLFSVSSKTDIYEDEDFEEKIITAYCPDTGNSFDLPPLPLENERPKDILVDGDIIYIVTTNWLLTYDPYEGTYTQVTKIEIPEGEGNFLIHEGRPVFIAQEGEGSFSAIDLISGQTSPFFTDDISPTLFTSDNEALYGWGDSEYLTRFESMWVFEK